MEVLFYVGLSLLWWVGSLTVLLPLMLLLLFNKSFQNVWFAVIYSKGVLPLLKHGLPPLRKRAFKLLEKEMPNRNKSVPIKMLEIGGGDGPNLPFYPENTKLTVVDVNPSFKNFYIANKEKYPHVELERIVTCMAEDMPEVEDNSVDVVVSTYVMCSVSDISKVLKEIKRVLKPGGKFLFLEHIGYHDRGIKYMIQRAVLPLWKIYFNGCKLDKLIVESSIDKAGFSNVSWERIYSPDLLLYIRPTLMGIATK